MRRRLRIHDLVRSVIFTQAIILCALCVLLVLFVSIRLGFIDLWAYILRRVFGP
jgi:hypothetical protein